MKKHLYTVCSPVVLMKSIGLQGSSQSSTARHPSDTTSKHLIVCVHLLEALSRSSKDGNWGALQSISDHINKFETMPPDSIRCALIQCACVIGAVSKGDALLEACKALSDELDLVPAKRFQSNRFNFVLHQLTTILYEGSICTGQDGSIAKASNSFLIDNFEELDCSLPDIGEDIKEVVVGPFSKLVSLTHEVLGLGGNALKPSSLLQLARLVMWFGCMDSNEHSSAVESLVLAIVKDPHPDFSTRRDSVPLVCQYLAQWSEARTFFHELNFAILSDPPVLLTIADINLHQEQAGVDPRFETEIEFFAGCAIACKELEIECLYLLCVHASLYPSSMTFVQDALEFVSISLNYPSRLSYILLHQRALVIKWFMDGRMLEPFLGLRDLLCSESGMNNLRFLGDLKSMVVASLVAESKKDCLAMAAEMLGESTSSLLEANLPSILAVHKMRSVCETSAIGEVSVSTAPHSVLSEYLTDEDIKRQEEGRRVDILEVRHDRYTI